MLNFQTEEDIKLKEDLEMLVQRLSVSFFRACSVAHVLGKGEEEVNTGDLE